MNRLVEGLAWGGGAFLLFCALQPAAGMLGPAVNVFAAAVLAFALREGERAGAVFGAACGLVMDAFSLGVFGLAGFGLTAAGFLTGYVSLKINVQTPRRTAAFLTLMAAAGLAVSVGLAAVVPGSSPPWGEGRLLAQPFVTGLLATGAYRLRKRLGTVGRT